MLRSATVRPGEPPRPSRGRPRKDGSPAQARTTTTTGQEATRDDPMPGSSDDHLRQPTTETDVIEQSIVMDSGTARASDDGADQEVLRMDQGEATETRGDNCSDQTRVSQNCCREARFGTSTQILCKHQNIEEPRVDSCIEKGGDQQVARKRSC